jgi:hypothetical protein
MYTLLAIVLVAFFAAVVTAVHLHLTAPRPAPVTLRPTDDIDAEFFRIIDREGLRDLTI